MPSVHIFMSDCCSIDPSRLKQACREVIAAALDNVRPENILFVCVRQSLAQTGGREGDVTVVIVPDPFDYKPKKAGAKPRARVIEKCLRELFPDCAFETFIQPLTGDKLESGKLDRHIQVAVNQARARVKTAWHTAPEAEDALQSQ